MESSFNKQDDVFVPNMPKLQSIGMMEFEIVLHHLQNLPASMYYGMNFDEILENITKNEAYWYLTELAILNAKNKQPLAQVFDENSIEEMGSSIEFSLQRENCIGFSCEVDLESRKSELKNVAP